MNRAEILLTHVASQLMCRWLEPDFLWVQASSRLSQLTSVDFTSILPDDWRVALTDERGLPNLAFPWMETFLRSSHGSIDRLARATSDHVKAVHGSGGKIIVIGDTDYPPLLREIPDPPLCIMALGRVELLRERKIAVVGSRRACPRALCEARSLGQLFSNQGMVVVSGGAYGCDIAVHNGVLVSGLRPAPAVVVFAGGLGNFYPKGNMAVFRKLLNAGALFLSERLWTTVPRPRDFPIRNRIVSGLCSETVVMQANRASGAMTTAKLALDQGREVSVLRFARHDVAADGNVLLSDDGAASFATAQEWTQRVRAVEW